MTWRPRGRSAGRGSIPSSFPATGKAWLVVSLFLLPTWGLGGTAREAAFLRGADLSFLPQVEAGLQEDPLRLLRSHGGNTVRLRLWHNPDGGHGGLAEVLDMSRRARAAGLRILLDFHYSDTWADPGHQAMPEAWLGLSFDVLRDSVRTYTRDVLVALAAQSTPPAMVQLGNEVTSGLLWETGRVGGGHDSPEQWARLAGLLEAAMKGVDAAQPGELRPEIMIHLDRGADNAGARWFLDHLQEFQLPYDVIGLSYYPWWHGTLADLEANLDDLAGRYGKDLVVVETAYPWTLDWFDDTHNPVGQAAQLLPDYPATPAGQRAFLAEVLRLVAEVPGGRGRGVLWWAPDWIAVPGAGSSWENMALFDASGRPLVGWEAFGTPARRRP